VSNVCFDNDHVVVVGPANRQYSVLDAGGHELTLLEVLEECRCHVCRAPVDFLVEAVAAAAGRARRQFASTRDSRQKVFQAPERGLLHITDDDLVIAFRSGDRNHAVVEAGGFELTRLERFE
jgi:hypothetical protein